MIGYQRSLITMKKTSSNTARMSECADSARQAEIYSQKCMQTSLRRAAAVGLMINKTFSGHFLPEYSGWCLGWECLKDVLASHSWHVTPGHVTRTRWPALEMRPENKTRGKWGLTTRGHVQHVHLTQERWHLIYVDHVRIYFMKIL